MALHHELLPYGRRPSSPELPPELAAFLAGEPFACVTEATSLGTAYICKAPAPEIARIPRTVPLNVHHELRPHPAAPVIRTLIHLFDQPHNPLSFETFINVRDPDQRQDFAALATQPHLLLLFYDERLAHRMTLRAPRSDESSVREILERAKALARCIPDDHYDFDRAKSDIMARTSV